MKKFIFAFIATLIFTTMLNAAAAAAVANDYDNNKWMDPLLEYSNEMDEVEGEKQGIFDKIWDSLVTKVIRDTFKKLLDMIMMGFNNVMSQAGEFLNLGIVKEALNFTTALSISLLIPKILIEIINTYFLFRAGDPDADVKNLVIRIAFAGFVIATSATLYQLIFDFGVKVGNDVARLVSIGNTEGTAGFSYNPGTHAILMLAFLIVLLMIYFQMLIRGAEMAVYKILMPLFALNLTSVNQGYFGSFLKQSLVVCLSQALQLLLFKTCVSVALLDSGGGIMMALAFAWITFKSPKLIKEIMYSSGLGASVGSFTRTAGAGLSTAVMRKIIR